MTDADVEIFGRIAQKHAAMVEELAKLDGPYASKHPAIEGARKWVADVGELVRILSALRIENHTLREEKRAALQMIVRLEALAEKPPRKFLPNGGAE